MRTHAMGEMTVKEIREYLKTNQTIILPYGVVEQHGYHLPLSMDIHNAEVPSYALAEKLGCISEKRLSRRKTGNRRRADLGFCRTAEYRVRFPARAVRLAEGGIVLFFVFVPLLSACS